MLLLTHYYTATNDITAIFQANGSSFGIDDGGHSAASTTTGISLPQPQKSHNNTCKPRNRREMRPDPFHVRHVVKDSHQWRKLRLQRRSAPLQPKYQVKDPNQATHHTCPRTWPDQQTGQSHHANESLKQAEAHPQCPVVSPRKHAIQIALVRDKAIVKLGMFSHVPVHQAWHARFLIHPRKDSLLAVVVALQHQRPLVRKIGKVGLVPSRTIGGHIDGLVVDGIGAAEDAAGYLKPESPFPLHDLVVGIYFFTRAMNGGIPRLRTWGCG